MKTLFLFLICFALLACTGTGTSTDDTAALACSGELNTDTLSLTSDKDGQLQIPVTLTENDAAFMVLSERGSGTISTDGVANADGITLLDWQDWASSRESLTNSFYAAEDVSVLNWPIREEDGSLSAGEWTVFASTLDADGYPKAKQSVDITVLRRACVSGTPTVKVTLVYTAGLDEDREVSSAVEEAAARWQELYSARGVNLDVSYAAVNLDGSLPEPLPGDSAYADVYDSIGEGVVVVIGDDVGGSDELYGEAGGIPGAQIASPHSVVAVGWMIHAGADLSFDSDEIELLAETMAHESGHFLGLYHPVESSYDYWDALSDTKKCTSASSCESALGDNLMFPYPICTSNRCTAQTELTDGQGGILLNNVGVR